ncbi:MAG: ABC transporter permease [Candidatus Cloacimonetes bacterium]|nr:ABC transporter permease [Candidatus Cloacimonadota bacterium]
MNRASQKKSAMDFFLFLIQTVSELLKVRGNRHVSNVVVMRQILFTGVEALPLISFIALAIGGLVIMQGYELLSNFGQGIWIHIILVRVVVIELSGILTALVVIARSGTAISTELGNMVVSGEMSLLKSFGISPLVYLGVSRIIGVVVAMVVLTLYFNIVAVLGGWLFSQFFNHLEFRAFMSDFVSVLKLSYIIMSFLKSILFGFIIAITASYHGMSVQKASTEVPQRTIKAVVSSIFAVIIADICISWIFWMLQ